MGAFRYQALDEKGREVDGILEGDAARHVRDALRKKGFSPLTVEAIRTPRASAAAGSPAAAGKPARSLAPWRSLRKNISGAGLAVLMRQFATLLRAGLPVVEALTALQAQSNQKRARELLSDLRSRVQEGRSLAAVMADYPRTFPALYLRLIEAGEQSGRLTDVLERLADHIESRQALQQKVVLALLYPMLLSVVAVAVVSGLLVTVVPQVTRVFENTHQALPLATRLLMGVSAALRGHAFAGFLIAAAAAAAGVAVSRSAVGRKKWGVARLRLPLIGSFTRSLNAARLSSTLGILTASGVPLVNALQSAANVVHEGPMRTAVQEALRAVTEGRGFSRSLDKSGLFPPVMIHLIASGEASGRLDVMLQRAAESQQRELETRVGAFTALFEPALILVMGGLVLFIVLAILMPIVQMNQLIR